MGVSIPQERRSNVSRASSRGGYTATYEQPSRVTLRPNSRMSSQKETSSAVRSGSRDTMGVVGAPGAGDQSAVVFPNMEYERQSMISQIPASDLVSIHSQNPDARSATNISLGGVPDDSAASVVSSSNTDYKRSSARGGSATAHRQQSFNPDLSSIRSQEENTSFSPRPPGTSNSIAEENSFQQAPPALEEREEAGSVVEQPSHGSVVEQPPSTVGGENSDYTGRGGVDSASEAAVSINDQGGADENEVDQQDEFFEDEQNNSQSQR